MGLLLAVLVTAADVDDATAAAELFARLEGQPMGKVVIIRSSRLQLADEVVYVVMMAWMHHPDAPEGRRLGQSPLICWTVEGNVRGWGR